MLVFILAVLFNVQLTSSAIIDYVDCGIDHEQEVTVGEVEIFQYPWVGILYYIYYGDVGAETRAVTTVVLIHSEFVLAAAADIGPMPKYNFRQNARVLIGESWRMIGRRVRSYVLHPEYGDTNTMNTVAIVQLKDAVRDAGIKPLCPPPRTLRNPVFYVVKFQEDFTELKKEVIPVSHVPSELCKEFYIIANLYSKHMRPPHVACAVSMETEQPCVWQAGSALVARDVWGRWQFLGLGVRGPGCGAPARFLDMVSYYPWIEQSVQKFKRLTITKLSNHKFVLRSSADAVQRFGACDSFEKSNIIYRDAIRLETDNNQFQFITYNLTIHQNVDYTCLSMELVNASASSEIRVKHMCPRNITHHEKTCHYYKDSSFDIALFLVFSDTCYFDLQIYGKVQSMSLIDLQDWKHNEGSFYEDFNVRWTEFRGPQPLSEFGYEPIDEKMWVPEYDIWTTTTLQAPNTTTTSTTTTTELTTTTRTYSHTKRYWRRRTRTPRTTTTTTTPTTTTKPPIDTKIDKSTQVGDNDFEKDEKILRFGGSPSLWRQRRLN